MGLWEHVLHEDDPTFVPNSYWYIPPSTYVDFDGPQLNTSLFDDPDKLRADWEQTVESMQRDAARPAEEVSEVIRLTEERLYQLGFIGTAEH